MPATQLGKCHLFQNSSAFSFILSLLYGGKKRGTNPDECKLRWKNIRDNYLKNKRKQKQGTGSAASSRPTKWPLFEHLKFLELVKSERRRIHNFKENENDRNSQSEVFVDDASESGSQNIRDIESDNIASPESVEFNIPSKRAKPNIDTSRSNSPSLSGHLHTL
ncbi:hypothetical protein ABEB36_015247 [Hypothenemus hampei]|uniref:MADF domain-containing protein n=1 Tax=Hypothenemus hampei TaxID=57062 RepID=A0ABD1E0V1_HYPHA